MKIPRNRMLALAATVMVAVLLVENWPADEMPASSGKDLSAWVVPPAQAASRPAAAVADDALDTRRIALRVAEAMPPPADAFIAHSWVRPPPPPPPPPPPAPPPPPPPPQAPPLPFKYLGRLEESPQRTVWYLGQGEEVVVVASGETIRGDYRVDGFQGGRLLLTYLPLNIQQGLPIGAAP